MKCLICHKSLQINNKTGLCSNCGSITLRKAIKLGAVILKK